MSDTVFALATPPGRGALAIVRIAGPGAGDALRRMTGKTLPAPRRASVRRLRDGAGGLIDEAVAIWWPGPASYTGEDGAELHLHGGAAVTAAVLERLSAMGLRAAAPGEFTRRAFEHGRIDLTQAEAVADLVEAETNAQRRMALDQLGGALSRRYEAWRERLLDVLALLEAVIDFPDEDLPPDLARGAVETLTSLSAELAQASSDLSGERIRDGVRVVLFGAPNVGKSSLLNALLGREAAIVTPLAGTTRDVVEGAMALAGQLVRLSDTAGLRSSGDIIEQEGMRRARAAVTDADIRVGVADLTRPWTIAEARSFLRRGDILALNKDDLADARGVETPAMDGVEAVCTSANVAGVTSLRKAIAARVVDHVGDSFPAATRTRHRDLLRATLGHLQRATRSNSVGPELMAEDVRLAVRSLEQVTGRTNPEAVLDRVFGAFCIGK